MAATAPETKHCVVCGQGSTRTDWINKSGNFVACDGHTKDEVAKAVAAAQAKLATPVGGTKPATPIPAAAPATKPS